MKNKKGTLKNLLMVLLMVVALATPVAVKAETAEIKLELAEEAEGKESVVLATKVEEVTPETYDDLPKLQEGEYKLMDDMMLFARGDRGELCHYYEDGTFEPLYLDNMKFVQIGESYYLYGFDDGVFCRIEISPYFDPAVTMAPIPVRQEWLVESDMNSKADFYALEKLPEGYYQVRGTDVSILVQEYQNKNKGDLETNVAVQVNHTVVMTLSNAVLVEEPDTIALWGESFHRSLDRVDLLADEISAETDVVWIDFPSYKDVKACGSWTTFQSDEITFGECQTDIGWHYGLYSCGEELGEGVDVESRLHFLYNPGIAVDEEGEVYMLYFSSEPWEIQLVEVEMPEKVDYVDDFWSINGPLYRDDDSYGYASVSIGDKEYVIKTIEHEALLQNGLDNLERYSEPLGFEPTFEVVEAIPENFETFDAWYGTDTLTFHVDAYFPCEDGDGNYFSKTFHLTEEVENHWLGMLIPENEFFNMRTQVQLVDEFVPEGESLWYFNSTSFDEVEAKMKKLEVFLDKWEEAHKEEIVSFFMEDPKWAEVEPEDAAKYGISYKDECLKTTSENLKLYFEHLRKSLLAEGYGESYAERELQKKVNQYFVDHPEVFEAHREVAAEYGVKAMDAHFWLGYLEGFDIWGKHQFLKNNPDVANIVPIYYKEVMAQYDQLFE